VLYDRLWLFAFPRQERSTGWTRANIGVIFPTIFDMVMVATAGQVER